VSYDDGPALLGRQTKNGLSICARPNRFHRLVTHQIRPRHPNLERTDGARRHPTRLCRQYAGTILKDLANDPQFRGRLIIDVTEPLFFSSVPFFFERPTKNLNYYHDHTIAQDISFQLHSALESQLVFSTKKTYP
jgi:hypothetical protein